MMDIFVLATMLILLLTILYRYFKFWNLPWIDLCLFHNMSFYWPICKTFEEVQLNFEIYIQRLNHIFHKNTQVDPQLKRKDIKDERMLCSRLSSGPPFLFSLSVISANPINLHYQFNILLISCSICHNPPDLLLCLVCIRLIHTHSFQHVVLLFPL